MALEVDEPEAPVFLPVALQALEDVEAADDRLRRDVEDGLLPRSHLAGRRRPSRASVAAATPGPVDHFVGSASYPGDVAHAFDPSVLRKCATTGSALVLRPYSSRRAAGRQRGVVQRPVTLRSGTKPRRGVERRTRRGRAAPATSPPRADGLGNERTTMFTAAPRRPA